MPALPNPWSRHMIEVTHLTKYYGDFAAVRDVTFSVGRGEVVGFLGPNGAGKSTTMRMLTGYLIPSGGSAVVAGCDVLSDPLKARSLIGYMPENCPLYPDMRVEEYLSFRAGIKGVHGSAARSRVAECMDKCWLTGVRRQLVGTLSKGYRQRVGLADALVGNPPVLILDEPTSGLDPTQIIETRKLIAELGQDRTVLVSTHILSEVEKTCTRAVIIARGKVLAQGPLADLCPSGQSLEKMFLDLVEEREAVGA